ncbi:MAG: ester cyclase [Dehalococcoidia bacterium]
MDANANKATIRRVREEALSQGRFDLLDGVYAPDYRYHGGETFGELEGPEAFKMVAGGFRQVIEGMCESVVDQIAEGDRVLTRLAGRGRAVGEILGVQGKGQDLTWTAMVLSRFNEKGQIVEEWVEADALGLVRQLGG